MKAVVLKELGPPKNLVVEERPDPVAGPGEVVVRLKAAGLNHRDVWIRKGQYAKIQLPTILGSDGAGEVQTVGPDVDPQWLGQAVLINPGLHWGDDEACQGRQFRVLGMPDDGTYAQLVKIPVTNIHPKPQWMGFNEAAALPLASLTAYRALFVRAQLQPEETVLITGIGGGVSSLGFLMAKAVGATVLVTSGSEEKLEEARKLGADGAFNYRSAEWVQAVKEATGGLGPHVVLDGAGGETFSQAVELVRPGGRIAVYGATVGLPNTVNLRKLFWNQLNIFGSTMGSPRDFAAMLDLYQQHQLCPVIGRTFSMAEAADAHHFMETGGQFGKIILEIP